MGEGPEKRTKIPDFSWFKELIYVFFMPKVIAPQAEIEQFFSDFTDFRLSSSIFFSQFLLCFHSEMLSKFCHSIILTNNYLSVERCYFGLFIVKQTWVGSESVCWGELAQIYHQFVPVLQIDVHQNGLGTIAIMPTLLWTLGNVCVFIRLVASCIKAWVEKWISKNLPRILRRYPGSK